MAVRRESTMIMRWLLPPPRTGGSYLCKGYHTATLTTIECMTLDPRRARASRVLVLAWDVNPLDLASLVLSLHPLDQLPLLLQLVPLLLQLPLQPDDGVPDRHLLRSLS